MRVFKYSGGNLMYFLKFEGGGVNTKLIIIRVMPDMRPTHIEVAKKNS